MRTIYNKTYNPINIQVLDLENGKYTSIINYRYFDKNHMNGYYKSIYAKTLNNKKNAFILLEKALSKMKIAISEVKAEASQ